MLRADRRLRRRRGDGRGCRRTRPLDAGAPAGLPGLRRRARQPARAGRERAMSAPTFVIVGGGLAAGKAAAHLREQGFDGRLLVICAEPERPYERPPLSKDYLRGESEREKAYVHEQGFYEDHQIELETDTTVTTID